MLDLDSIPRFQFEELWRMYEEKANGFIQEILYSEALLSERLLGEGPAANALLEILAVGSQPTWPVPLNEIPAFWSQYGEAFEEKHHVWNAFEFGLKQYLLVLKERDQLNSICAELRRKNEELTNCLQNASSK